jgi:hypothetical protein
VTQAEIQELIDDVPCDLCYMSPGLAQYAILAAMLDIANGDSVPATTQALISEANCLLCMVPPGLVPYLQIQALRNISSGGSGSGSGSVTCGVADPVAAPTVTCALHYRRDNGALWMWNGAAWIQLIAP